MTWRAFLAGCWWDHDLRRERHGKHYVLKCSDCGYQTTVLKGQKFRRRKEVKKVLPFGQRKKTIMAQGSRRA